MNLNATLFGQMITFAILVWFTMRYVWPPIVNAMQEREKKIAAGLAAAERSMRELEITEQKVRGMLQEAKGDAAQILDRANKHSLQLIAEAKEQARAEQKRMIALAQDEITREVNRTKEDMTKHMAALAIAGAEKIVRHQLDRTKQMALLNNFLAEI